MIRKEIGDKRGEASAYGNLGTVFLSVGQYTKAQEYLLTALVIRKESATKKEKHLLTQIWELCFSLLINASRLKITLKEHW